VRELASALREIVDGCGDEGKLGSEVRVRFMTSPSIKANLRWMDVAS
jgi:hypothetical protein